MRIERFICGFALNKYVASVGDTTQMLQLIKCKGIHLQQQISQICKKLLVEGREGGGVGKSEKAFNMITAGMDAREERRRGSGGGEEQQRGHAHIDKYFIPQHTESVRPGPRGGCREGGAKNGQKDSDKKQRG